MKLKYILQTFFIALLAIVAGACDETIDDSLLGESSNSTGKENIGNHDLVLTAHNYCSNYSLAKKNGKTKCSVPRAGGSNTYDLYANQSQTSWKILNMPSWATVSPTSGTAENSNETEITFTANSDNESSTKDRVATIILKGSYSDGWEKNYEITLYQLGMDTYFKTADITTDFSGDAQTTTCTVDTNIQEVELSTDKSWLSASYNASDKTLTISVSENPSSTYRKGSITVKEKGNINDTQTFNVYQYGK
jgi:hypothetical protein